MIYELKSCWTSNESLGSVVEPVDNGGSSVSGLSCGLERRTDGTDGSSDGEGCCCIILPFITGRKSLDRNEPIVVTPSEGRSVDSEASTGGPVTGVNVGASDMPLSIRLRLRAFLNKLGGFFCICSWISGTIGDKGVDDDTVG